MASAAEGRTADGDLINGLFQCSVHATNLLERMRSSCQQQQFCDVVLVAGNDNTRVNAHRLVLTAASDYFQAMFTGSMREAHQDVVTLGDVDGVPLQTLVEYCYTGRVQLLEENVVSLLLTAQLLQLEEVVSACSRFLAKQLHPSNCLGIAAFAERQCLDMLFKEAESYARTYFTLLCKNDEFLELTVTKLSTFIASDEICVPNEEQVFESIMLWVDHDRDTRIEQLPELIASVRWSQLKQNFIIKQLENPIYSKLFEKANKQNAVCKQEARPSTRRIILAVSGGDSIKLESYCSISNRWTPWNNSLSSRTDFAAVILDDMFLMLVGGRRGSNAITNNVQRVDLLTLTCTELTPMNTCRAFLGVASLNDVLYAVGGTSGNDWLDTVERWDPQCESWSYTRPMSSKRSSAGVAAVDGLLYVCGGFDGTVRHNSLECYHPHGNYWTTKAPMHERRSDFAIAILNSHLYVVGGWMGRQSLISVERYDIAADKWTLLHSLTTARYAIGTCALNHRIIAIAGYNGSQNIRNADEYDPHKNQWRPLTPLTYTHGGVILLQMPNITAPLDDRNRILGEQHFGEERFSFFTLKQD